MNNQSPFLNYKLNNTALSNRFKTRFHKSSNNNFNIKQMKYIDYKNFNNIEDVRFSVNSRPLEERKTQKIKSQVKKQQQNPESRMFVDDSKKLYVNAQNLNKMPSISATYQQSDRSTKEKQKKLILIRPYHSQNKVKRCTCGNCDDCMKDFAYYLHLCSPDNSIPQISAKSWCIWKQKNDKFYHYYGKRILKVREIASLTKMITAMVMMDYVQKYNIDLQKVKYVVRKSSGMIGGTTAKLNVGQGYNLKQLLYGMMLPSGNDAAIAISEVISLMISLKNKNKKFDPVKQDWCNEYANKNYSYIFIAAMNEKVQKLGTLDTKLFNSHGNDAYDQLKNISTCNQIAKISSQFLKYSLLRQVVKTKQFKFQNGNVIENTNKLLEDGFEGIKTGITDTAGPCLAACYKDLIIVVLNSKSMNERWIQVKKLVKWIKNKT